MESYEIIVISAGACGLQAANLLRLFRINYIVIEQAGSDARRCGNIAIQALIESAQAFHLRKRYDILGIQGAQHVIANIPNLLTHIRNMRDEFIDSQFCQLEEHPVIYASACFVDSNVLKAGNRMLKADKILICTGSCPYFPDRFAPLKNALFTIDNLIEQEDLPQSLAIVGMDSAGIELAQALARLGIEVFAIEPTATIAGIADPEIKQSALSILQRDMRIYLETDVQSVEKEDDFFRIYCRHKTMEVSGILLNAGRLPNLKGLGLNELNIPYSGEIPVFDRRTQQILGKSIYVPHAENDSTPLSRSSAVRCACVHALGKNGISCLPALKVARTDPPIASLGKKNRYVIEGRANLDDMTLALPETPGLAKLYATAEGVLTGAELIGPEADHLAHFLLFAVQKKLCAKQILELPVYPASVEKTLCNALAELANKI